MHITKHLEALIVSFMASNLQKIFETFSIVGENFKMVKHLDYMYIVIIRPSAASYHISKF